MSLLLLIRLLHGVCTLARPHQPLLQLEIIMAIRNHMKRFVPASIVLFACAPQWAMAQASKLQQSEPPQGVVSTAQPWVTHQKWFCIPRGNYNANNFAVNMAKKIGALGSVGWEPVAIGQVSLAGESCFLATFKAPKQK